MSVVTQIQLPDLSTIIVGFGYDNNQDGNLPIPDTDLMSVARDAKGETRNEWVCYYQQLTTDFMRQGGDGLIYEGNSPDGDDEQVLIGMRSIPQEVESIDLIVCLYKSRVDVAFRAFSRIFMRIIDPRNGEVIVRARRIQFPSNRAGIYLGRLVRTEYGWEYQVMMEFAPEYDNFQTFVNTANPVKKEDF